MIISFILEVLKVLHEDRTLVNRLTSIADKRISKDRSVSKKWIAMWKNA